MKWFKQSNMTQAQEDLLTWEEDEAKALPMSEAAIAALEAAGYVVNLDTGAIVPEEEANGYTVSA